MPAPLARGIILTVSVLVAAGIAAYENPQIREWIERTRHKIAIGLHSLGDEIEPKRRSTRQMDASMTEDNSEMADARRRQAIAELMERGRVMEERRKRRRLSERTEKSQPSFDTLVDGSGMLREDESQSKPIADTSSVQIVENHGSLKSRHLATTTNDTNLLIPEIQPDRALDSQMETEDPFESCYEREMRMSWNLPLPNGTMQNQTSHASESLIDLTPTTEEVPDPDVSIPSTGYSDHHVDQSDYFSVAASRSSSHTLAEQEPSRYYAHPSRPMEPLVPRQGFLPSHVGESVSSASSVAGSVSLVNLNELEDSEDDVMSEIGDGVRTPGSAWTEVSSTISGDI